jgi:hypothetical protein
MSSNSGSADGRVGAVLAVALLTGMAFTLSLPGPSLWEPPPDSSFVIEEATVEAEEPPVAIADELPDDVVLLATKAAPRPERLALDTRSAPITAAVVPQALPTAARSDAQDETIAEEVVVPVDPGPAVEPLLPMPVEPATPELAPGEPPPVPLPEEAMRDLMTRLKPVDTTPAAATVPTPSAPAAAAPLPGDGWTDPDGVNWSDATPGRDQQQRTSRLLGRIGERLGEVTAKPDPATGQTGPLGGRLLDRVRDRIGQRDDAAARAPPTDDAGRPADGWPTPTTLVDQLARLAADGTGPQVTWATATRAALDAVVATRGPGDPATDAALIELGEHTDEGMAVADAIAAPAAASQVRRAALAVSRRVAVWRAATAGCLAPPRPATSPETGSAGPPVPLAGADVCRVLHALERFETSRRAVDAVGVRESLRSVVASSPVAGRGLDRAVHDHYLSPNVRIAIHEEFLERLLPESTVTSGPLQDFVLGRKVRGTKTVEQSTGVRFTPHPTEIRLDLLVTGEVTSRTVTEAGTVAIHSRGVSMFTVHKPIHVSGRGLAFGPARGSASNQSQLAGIETGFDAVPLMGPLVRGIVRSQHDENLQEASREVNVKIVTRACREVDQQTEPRLTEAAARVRDRFWTPMVRLGLEPTAVALETTAGVATARLRLAADSQLAAHTPRPRAPEDALFSIQVHESSVNNACGRFDLAGRKMSLEELTRFVCGQLGIPPQVPDDLPEGVDVTFATEEPLRVECHDGLVHVRVALDALESGRRNNWYDIVGHVAYRPAIKGIQVVLEREGPVQLSGPGHKGRMEFGLRTIFGKMFPKERPVALVPDRVVTDTRMRGVQAVQAVVADGWFAVALAPVTQAVTVRTSPTAARPDGGPQRIIRR